MDNTNKYYGLAESQPAHKRFALLDSYKSEVMNLARECSSLTKPLVVPPLGHTPGATTFVPQQSHGSRLVSNLVSQLLLILFPPGIPFFKLDLESVDIREMSKGIELPNGKSMHDALRESFVSLENNSATELLVSGVLEKLRMIILQLVVSGNSCFLTRDELELIPLADWVCSRSSSGDLIEVIYKQSYPVSAKVIKEYSLGDDEINRGYVEVYTRCFRSDTMWTVEEFVGTSSTPTSSIQVTDKKFWVNITPWELTPGEDYGRGPVEESLGDIRTFDSGTGLVNQSATALAKVIFTVRPNGLTRAQDVADADNTEIISGDPNDVGVIQANKVYDMSGFIQFLADIKRELDIAFMMPSAIRRDGERVTAEEIRRMATEFEKSRGGTYNALSRNIQTPIARLLLRGLIKTMPQLRLGDLLPIVNTGLQGLGRSLELENTLMFINDLNMVPGMIQMLNTQQLIFKLAALRGLEVTNLVKTPEQLQVEQQQASLDSMATQVAPDMIKGAMTQ